MSMQREFAQRGLRARKNVKRDGHWIWITLEGDVEVKMNISAIGERIGQKAIRSAGKRATALSGMIVAKAKNIVEVT